MAQQSFIDRHYKNIQKALNQPGVLNDLLAFAEKQTGVNRIYIAPGNSKL